MASMEIYTIDHQRTELNEESDPTSGSETTSGSTQSPTTVEQMIFAIVVVFIGLIGCSANGLVMSAFLFSKKLRSQSTNKLIINQVSLDLFASFFITISYSTKIQIPYFQGFGGYLACALINSDSLSFIGLAGSISGLALITTERYLKIVFPFQHRKYVKDWMVYCSAAISWINGILINMIMAFWTSNIKDGYCYSYYFWPSIWTQYSYSGFVFVWEFVIPLLMFVYCYGHILFIVKKSAKVFPGHEATIAPAPIPAAAAAAGAAGAAAGAAATSAGSGVNRSQLNIIKTMVIVCLAFFVCWSPNQVFFLLSNLQIIDQFSAVSLVVYYVSVFMIYINVCLNPFIYATKHEQVKKHLAAWWRKVQCHKHTKENLDHPMPDATVQTEY